MSLRQRPKDLQDRFESRDLGTFNDKPVLINSTPEKAETRQFVPNLNVPQSLEAISVLLLDFQSKGTVIDTQDDEYFRMWFPYTWHSIQVGDEIKNITTGQIYKTEEIITTHPQFRKNYVLLRGKTQPKPWHILRMDSRRNDLVSIIPAYPDTEVKPYEFTEEGHLQTPETSTWNDIITYTVLMESPGSLEGKMFAGGVQERKAKFREDVDGTRWYGQWIDTRVRFDFWTRSNGDSERLREWFRDFNNKYRWLVEKNGVNRFLWSGSGTAEGATRWRNDIVHRSSSYDLRTEYSYSENLFKIRSSELQIVVPGQNQDEVIRIDNLT